MKINVYRKLPQRPTLAENQIDVWCWTIEQLSTLCYEWETLVSWSERQRASRFCSPQQYQSYIVTRGMVRYLIGRYLRQEPASLPLEVNTDNTLHLQDSDLRFEFGYTDDVVTIAVARQMKLGVHVEPIKEIADLDKLARFMLNSSEAKRYGRLRHRNKLQTFYQLWTRKSAIFQVAGDPRARLDQLGVWDDGTFHWGTPDASLYVRSLDLIPHYSGAVAYRLPTA